jgi:HlyD family secretion protein
VNAVRAALLLLVLLAACAQRDVRSYSGFAEGEYVRVTVPLSGSLAKLNVKPGAKVRAGETLFSLDAGSETAARREAQERVAATEAQLKAAQRAGRRDEIRVAEAALTNARTQLAELNWRLEQKTAKAPKDGVIVETPFVEGQWIEAGLAVVSILSPESIKVRFFVPSHVASALRHGQTVNLRCADCGQFEASIAYVSPLAEPGGSEDDLRFLVEARPAASVALSLRPGQAVEIVL